VLWDQGDLEAASRSYDEAIRRRPDDASAFYNRGLLRTDQGDLEGAVRDYNDAIRLQPDHPDALIDRDAVLATIADRAEH
jgi:tetratricopeptide (TPR) repeat protein